MVLFRYGPQVCGSLDAGSRREWLVPDGCGGYAMGSVCGLRTRRYHGLLVVGGRGGSGRAGAEVPGRRWLALASLDPILTLPSGAEIRLATHEWASGAVAPRGHELLQSFELRDGLPRWRWRVGAVVLERTLAYRHGAPCLAVVHTLRCGGPVRLTLEPLCTWRDTHGERQAGAQLRVRHTGDGVCVESAYRVSGPDFRAGGQWYHGVHHREERERGLAAAEDLFRPGAFVAELDTGAEMGVLAWAGDGTALAAPPPPAGEVIEAARRRNRILAGGGTGPLAAALRLAADAFIVAPPRVTTGVERDPGPPREVQVVAGYPWFGAWSRDSMISYEGLFVHTGRAEQGRELLRAYAATLRDGLLPNTGDTASPELNTADAALWLLHAVDRHVTATGDTDLAATLVDALDSVVDHYRRGTRFAIGVDPADGLLSQGATGFALTWMDAVVDGVAVTARAGKAVELNALWINGLGALAHLRELVGRPAHDLDRLRAAAIGSFRRRFPAAPGWLFDVVDGPGGDDPALRPNQLLAFGLPYAPMRGADPTPPRWVGRALLTPLGVRTLAPDHPHYRGAHRGDQPSRDRAYHQGTVWPWLLGPYLDALRATGSPTEISARFPAEDSAEISAEAGVATLTDAVGVHLGEWGVGSVSETADGDPPHAATGCPFQAWSVAEVLRVTSQLNQFDG